MILRNREPDIDKFLGVLTGEKKSDRVHLFELFMDFSYYEYFAGYPLTGETEFDVLKFTADGFYNAGYDYATVIGCRFGYKTKEHASKKSYSANEGGIIKDWDSFNAYEWPDVKNADYSGLAEIESYLPKGFKLGVMSGAGGLLEIVTALIGYEDLCIMSFENPELLQAVFDRVGQDLVDYYTKCAKYDSVAFLISNDDWGFNTQTFLSVDEMRKYVFPWHKKMVEVAHNNNKPMALHSCGFMNDVFDDIIDDMKYDAKHSYEDNILSVEDSYKRYSDRITILGGLDLNFLITSTNEELEQRCKDIIKLTREKGKYMLGSGNSLADYVPIEKIIIMLKAALEA